MSHMQRVISSERVRWVYDDKEKPDKLEIGDQIVFKGISRPRSIAFFVSRKPITKEETTIYPLKWEEKTFNSRWDKALCYDIAVMLIKVSGLEAIARVVREKNKELWLEVVSL